MNNWSSRDAAKIATPSPRWFSLLRPHQHVALAAGAELHVAGGAEIAERYRLRFALDDRIVEPGAAAFDQPARLAVRCRETGADEQFEGRQAAGQRIVLDRDLRQAFGALAVTKHGGSGLGGFL